jgi:antibiotic biosynthesis monooxygenase (ABM) superfamily enzyme
MSHTMTDPARPILEVRPARASSVIVQRIPPDAVDGFLQWQDGVSAAAAEFPGYQTTEVYPPPDGKQTSGKQPVGKQPEGMHPEWVVVVHFDDAQTLQDWLGSRQRAEWLAKLPSETKDFQLKMLPDGLGSWFAGAPEGVGPFPHWKMFLSVLLGLYPTVMLLTFFLSPYTQRYGLAVAMLIGNAASVAFLEWLGMPILSRMLGPWLRANGKAGWTVSLVGLVLMLVALGVMTFLFQVIR